jgi:hydrogenase/urease accessory protein HupE
MSRTLLARVAAFALVIVSLAVPSRAGAHAVGLSRGDYSRSEQTVLATLTFARGDALVLAPSLDADADGALAEAEVRAGNAALEAGVGRRIAVRAAGVDCVLAATAATLTPGDGIAVRETYRCPGSSEGATVALDGLLEELPSGHRHMAHLVAEDRQVVLFHGQSALELGRPSPSGDVSMEHAPQHATAAASVIALFRMGIEHILTGYDHLLFLLGLVLVAPRARSLLPVVTAFTVAHSLTLGVAVLGLWTPPSRVVEPMIALSIAYVGVENVLMPGSVSKRWRVTFPFGLIHGFGFAAALRELALPRQAVPGALLSFNLGVEAGQIAVLAAMVPLVLLVQRTRWLEGARARIPSLGVAAVGAVWFVARIV